MRVFTCGAIYPLRLFRTEWPRSFCVAKQKRKYSHMNVLTTVSVVYLELSGHDFLERDVVVESFSNTFRAPQARCHLVP